MTADDAVAAVVTVLIITVIVVAIKVVLRPESLSLSVVGGVVSSTPQPAANIVHLGVKLRAENPSGRARMYFFNITAYLFDNKTVAAATADPEEDCRILFTPDDVAVAQQMAVVSVSDVQGKDDPAVMDHFHFDMLYTKRQVITDVAMRVEGRLVTEVRSGINRTSQLVTYLCWPLVVGGS
uniref:Late embryogenesis abundant protein LEA-2 subgroup domain-containing protein n=1 Tax=Setaria viridis TaxID=4556 RepID=A0A4U6URZ1_SETVI|nr:hypothetical protein SEVIR_4G013200v2 [Setaria viridis]